MFRMILVTAPHKDAEKLAKRLLEERLVACANLIPNVKSFFWWQGKLDNAKEVVIVFKAPKKNIKHLMKRIADLHPYDVPEIIVLNVEDAWKPYAKWVRKEAKA